MLTGIHTHTYTQTNTHAHIIHLCFRYQMIYISFIRKCSERSNISVIKYLPFTYMHICDPYKAYSYKDLSTRKIISYMNMYTRVVRAQTRESLRHGKQIE